MSIQIKDADFDGTTRNINKHDYVMLVVDIGSVTKDEMVVAYTTVVSYKSEKNLASAWEAICDEQADLPIEGAQAMVMLKVNDPKDSFEVTGSAVFGDDDDECQIIRKWMADADNADIKSAVCMRNATDSSWTVDLESGKVARPKKIVSKAPTKKASSKKPSGAAAKKRTAAKKAPAKKAAAKKAPAKRGASTAKKAAAKKAAAKKAPAKAGTSSYVRKAVGARKRIASKRSK